MLDPLVQIERVYEGNVSLAKNKIIKLVKVNEKNKV